MYAVIFNIDTNCLKEQLGDIGDIYTKIKKFMLANGFEWKQGSVYFGNNTINAVSCVTTIQRLAKELPVLVSCCKDIRMLKIEENNDLMAAIQI